MQTSHNTSTKKTFHEIPKPDFEANRKQREEMEKQAMMILSGGSYHEHGIGELGMHVDKSV